MLLSLSEIERLGVGKLRIVRGIYGPGDSIGKSLFKIVCAM